MWCFGLSEVEGRGERLVHLWMSSGTPGVHSQATVASAWRNSNNWSDSTRSKVLDTVPSSVCVPAPGRVGTAWSLGLLPAQTVPGFYGFRKCRVGILLSLAFPHSSGVSLEELQMIKMRMGRCQADGSCPLPVENLVLTVLKGCPGAHPSLRNDPKTLCSRESAADTTPKTQQSSETC